MKPYDLGVLFVHGIGLQTRGDTMLHWGEELHTCIARWIAGANGGRGEGISVLVEDALIGQDPLDRAAPAHSKWIVTVPKGPRQRSRSTWLVAESCWAESFVTPRYADFASWSFRTLPWTLASHFGRRLRRASARMSAATSTAQKIAGLGPLLPESCYALAALVLMPVIVALVLLLLVIGLIPIPKVRELAAAFQRTLSATLGDSFVLLDSPIQAAAITGHVRRDLDWLCAKCNRVAVVAHSQGAAISHAVLRAGAPAEARLFISIGSGLNKLSEIKRVKDTDQKWMPWLAVAGAAVLAISARGPLHLLQAVRPLELIGWFLAYVFFAALAFRVLETKWRWKNWLAGLLGLPAAASCGLLVYHLMSRAEGMAYVFAGGAALLLTGASPAWKRGLGAGDFARKFRLRRIRWLDFYASSDPVPNGSLLDEAAGVGLETWEVDNRGSPLDDHTAYWKNHDGFVTRAAVNIARQAGVRLDALSPRDRQCLDVAEYRRRWRVGCLKAIRLMVAALAAAVTYGRWSELSSLATSIPSSLAAALKWAGEMAQKWKLVPEEWKLAGVEQSNRWIGVGAVVAAALALYAALYLVWKWWNAAERSLFFARRDYVLVSVPAGVLWFAAALSVEGGIFVAAGRATALLEYGLHVVALAAIVSALSITWRVLQTVSREAPLAAARAHAAAWAGRAAVSCLVLLPAFAADRLVYANLIQRGDWSQTGPISGACLFAVFVVLCLAGRLMRSRAGMWVRRHLDSWSYSGNLADVWKRHRLTHRCRRSPGRADLAGYPAQDREGGKVEDH